jgi:undecaprenyl-diphosphatase
MDLLTSVILGLVQGLTEFLPISSSGHLVLFQHLLGFQGPALAYDVMLHLGTTLAVVIYFRHDIANIFISAFTKSSSGDGRRWIIMIILASIPTALIGLLFKDQFEVMFDSPGSLAMQFWVTGLLLIITDRVRVNNNTQGNIKTHQAFFVGVAQGIAIIPAVSRSGLTIAAGVISGMSRETAARFSFLISIPAILGATLLEGKDIAGTAQIDWLPSLIGTAVAFISGYLSIGLLLRLVVKRGLWMFAVYLFVIGLLTFILV